MTSMHPRAPRLHASRGRRSRTATSPGCPCRRRRRSVIDDRVARHLVQREERPQDAACRSRARTSRAGDRRCTDRARGASRRSRRLLVLLGPPASRRRPDPVRARRSGRRGSARRASPSKSVSSSGWKRRGRDRAAPASRRWSRRAGCARCARVSFGQYLSSFFSV